MEIKSAENLEFNKVLKIIAEFASSYAAKEKILGTFPTNDEKKIATLLNEIQDFENHINFGLNLSFSGIRDIREIISLLKSGKIILAANDFLDIAANIHIAKELKDKFKTITEKENAPHFNNKSLITQYIENMPALSSIYERINKCIDDKGNVKNSASSKLSSIRKELSQTKKTTEKRLQTFINNNSANLQDNFFTIRNDRYVLPVIASAQSQVQGIIHDQSATGQTLFIEPLEFLPLNNKLARLRLSEKEEIKKIFESLTIMLVSSLNKLEELFETLIYLDFLNAKIRFNAKYQCNKPIISNENQLNLVNARHPLLHPNCVPLNITLGKKHKCIVITGPNGGGKTVTLKITGLCAMLTQSGFYIPADSGSSLPVFNNILSDIGESQSIENHLSTFTAHLKRIKEIYEQAKGGCLILIDEICVGTDPIEGGKLAAGFLKQIVKNNNFAIVTSHYDSLKEMAFTTTGFINSAMEFDYETFKPTFRFRMGVPGKSNALAMAKAFKLPPEILQEFSNECKECENKEVLLLEAIERERNRAEQLRRIYVEKLAKIRKQEAKLEKDLAKLKEFRKTKRDSLTEEFTRKLKLKVKELEKIICNLKLSLNDNKNTKLNDKEKEKQFTNLNIARENLKNTTLFLKELNRQEKLEYNKFNNNNNIINKQNIEKGDMVLWQLTGNKGTVIEIDSSKKRIIVDFEGKFMTLPQSQITKISTNTKSDAARKRSGTIYAPSQYISDRLDLRGLRVEEAIEKITDYLKLAKANKLEKVHLIHGKGTGALQKAIHAFLKRSEYKNKFRLGRYGEGDLGVTVVVFNPAADNYKDIYEKRLKPIR